MCVLLYDINNTSCRDDEQRENNNVRAVDGSVETSGNGDSECNTRFLYSESRLQTVEKIAARVVEIVNEVLTLLISVHTPLVRMPTMFHWKKKWIACGWDLKVITDVSFDSHFGRHSGRCSTMCVEEYGAALINDISAGDGFRDVFYCAGWVFLTLSCTWRVLRKPCSRLRIMIIWWRKYSGILHGRYISYIGVGVKDPFLDPGFGFGKTLEHNHGLMGCLEDFALLTFRYWWGYRASRWFTNFWTVPRNALNGTTVLQYHCAHEGCWHFWGYTMWRRLWKLWIVRQMKSCAIDC